MWSAADPRPLYTVLAHLTWFAPGLVLVRGTDYGRVERLARKARREARSEDDAEARSFVTAFQFWIEEDRDRKVMVMWNPARPEPFMVEVGSRVLTAVEDQTGNSGLHGPAIGRAQTVACQRPQVLFERKCFEPGAYYGWDDLTPLMKRDAERQRDEIESVHGQSPEALTFHFLIVPHRELMGVLSDRFGPDLERLLESDDIQKIARSIEEKGLKSPPLGEEGWKRAVALASLAMDMPYLSVVPPFEAGPFAFATLEGRTLG
jgi:hypothetical protein